MENQQPLRLWDRFKKVDTLYWCLYVVVALDFLLIAFAADAQYYLKEYIMIPCAIFLYAAFARQKTGTAKALLGMGLVMTAWFVFVQAVHHHTSMDTRPLGMFFSVYLLALPFAALTREGESCNGLKMWTVGFLGGVMVLLVIAAFLLAGRVPSSLLSSVWYDYGRLNVMTHPNNFGGTLMIGVGLCLTMISMAKHVWVKGALWALVVLQFVVMALTNCRSAVIMGSLLLAGFVFFAISKGGFLRFVAGAVAAVLVAAGCFFGSQELFARHQKRILETMPIAQTLPMQDVAEESHPVLALATQTINRRVRADVPVNQGRVIASAAPGSIGNSPQRPLLETFPSFGGRTPIWQEEIKSIKQFPRVALLGIDYVREYLERTGNHPYAHSHNSWMEVLMILGIPGLVLASVFTLMAVWLVLATLFGKGAKLWQKTVALLVICILGISVTEPYLFLSGLVMSQGHMFHHIDFTFFLCLGYLAYWRAEAKRARRAVAAGTPNVE